MVDEQTKQCIWVLEDKVQTLEYKHRTVADDHRHVETRVHTYDPFEMKKRLDTLEPKVKKLESTSHLHNINLTHKHHWYDDGKDPCIQRCGHINCFETRTKPTFLNGLYNSPRGTGKMRMSYESFKEAIERDGMIVAIPVKELERLKRKGDYWKKSYNELLNMKGIYKNDNSEKQEIIDRQNIQIDELKNKIKRLDHDNDIYISFQKENNKRKKGIQDILDYFLVHTWHTDVKCTNYKLWEMLEALK